MATPRLKATRLPTGEWRLERQLGLGGFGEVWLARHAQMRSLTGAVKFYTGQSARDLVREAELIDRVMHAGSHPHIVPLRDIHLEGDSPWLMFDYVEGGTLADRIHHFAALTDAERVTQVTAVLRQICEAVTFVHGLNPPLVHRDLKPANVLYDKANERYRVTDFGIGALTASETLRAESRGTLTRAGRLQTYLRGSYTPLYASPQQRRGDAANTQDDVYALGVMAFQMLTGRLDAEVRADYARQLTRRGVGAELVELIGDCCAEELGDRPGDGAGVLSRLTAYESSIRALSVRTMRQITIPGDWYSCPVGKPEPVWSKVCSTPGQIETSLAESYKITVSTNITDADLADLNQLIEVPNLKAIVLRGCTQVTDKGISRVAEHLPNLTGLDLWGCDKVTDTGVSEVAARLTKLTSFALGNYDKVTDASLVQVAMRLSNLTWLTLCNCLKVTDAGVCEVAARLPKLTTLDLQNCHKVTDASVSCIAAKLPHLTLIDLRGCTLVTDAAVAEFKRALPSCKVEHYELLQYVEPSSASHDTSLLAKSRWSWW